MKCWTYDLTLKDVISVLLRTDIYTIRDLIRKISAYRTNIVTVCLIQQLNQNVNTLSNIK